MQSESNDLPLRKQATSVLRALGLDEAGFDSELRLGISLSEEIKADLVLVERQSVILATAGLMRAEEADMAMLAFLAEANAGWAVGAGCILSIPPGSGQICLTTVLPVREGAERFRAEFRRFARMAEAGRDRLGEMLDGGSDENA